MYCKVDELQRKEKNEFKETTSQIVYEVTFLDDKKNCLREKARLRIYILPVNSRCYTTLPIVSHAKIDE